MSVCKCDSCIFHGEKQLDWCYFLPNYLSLLCRERLVSYAYNMYFNQQTYYRVSALDTRLGGAEQRLTDDLSELASSVAHLYSSLTKPLLDCALVGIALISFSHRMGAKTIPGNCIILLCSMRTKNIPTYWPYHVC